MEHHVTWLHVHTSLCSQRILRQLKTDKRSQRSTIGSTAIRHTRRLNRTCGNRPGDQLPAEWITYHAELGHASRHGANISNAPRSCHWPAAAGRRGVASSFVPVREASQRMSPVPSLAPLTPIPRAASVPLLPLGAGQPPGTQLDPTADELRPTKTITELYGGKNSRGATPIRRQDKLRKQPGWRMARR